MTAVATSATASPGPVKLGRPRQVEDDAVFAAMAAVLMRAGWARLTLSLVARELNITPAALRQRFGSKHELLVAFYAWGTDRLRNGVFGATGLDRGAPLLETLRAMLRSTTEPFTTPQQMINALSAFSEVASESDLRPLAQERVRLAINAIELLLNEASARGELVGIDPARLARQLHVTVIGVCLVWSIDGQGVLTDRVQDAFEALVAPYVRSSVRAS